MKRGRIIARRLVTCAAARTARRAGMRGLLVATTLGLVAAGPSAAAPPNDNYLASKTMNASGGTLPPEYTDKQDTSTATTQSNVLDFDKNGAPLGGRGGAEPTTCATTSYGKTVWYDFVPPTAGGVRIVAGGFDAVIRVFEWDPATSLIRRSVGCYNRSSGSTEVAELQRQLRGGASYTVQVGGVNGAGGPLDFEFTFFPDTDGDGVLDEAPDRCRTVRGISATGGCPPLLRAAPRIRFDPAAGGGIKITSLVADQLTARSRVSVSCRRCGPKVSRTARIGGSLQLRGFVGRRVAAGDVVEMRVTLPRTSAGRYRYGAIGRVFRWRIRPDGLGPRQDSCLAANSTRKKTPCR